MTSSTSPSMTSRRPFHLWLATVLGVDQSEIDDIWSDCQSYESFPPFEHDSVMIAVEMLSPLQRAVFASHEPWDRQPVTFTDIHTSHDTTMRCATFGTYNVVHTDGGIPVMIWLIGAGVDIDVVATSPNSEARAEVLARIVELVNGPASAWRGQRVLFDESKKSWYRHLAPAQRPSIPPDEHVAAELRRNLIVPIQQYGLDDRIADRRGVLMHGRPGTGKTQALTWLQAELAELDRPVTTIVTTPTMFSNAAVIKDLFEMVAEAPPCLLVMEDIDLTLTDRAFGPVGNDALGELLQFMDGPARVAGAFVAATTNHPGILDDALTRRPGRFDRKIEVADATREARMQMATMLLERVGDDRGSAAAIADRTDGWSLAELDEAAHLAVLTSLDTGEAVNLLDALDQVHRDGDDGRRSPAETGPTIGYV